MLYVTTGCGSHRVRAVAVASAAQRRAARAHPLLRAWALVQRGRAFGAALALPHLKERLIVANGDDAPRAAGADDNGDDGDDDDATALGEARRANEALRRLTAQPVAGILALVLAFVTGDVYGILTDDRAPVPLGGYERTMIERERFMHIAI